MTTNPRPIHFASERDRKTYETGMAEVKRKLDGCHVPTAAEREAETIRRGNAEIIKRFGSKVALSKFNITSTKHVPSPAEYLDQIASKAAANAIRRFEAASKPAPAKRSTPAATSKPKAKAATVKNFSSGYSIKRFSTPFAR